MTIEALKRVHQTRPFDPFIIFVADGRELTVRHPENLAITPQGRTISVGLPDDSFEIIDLLLVTGLRTLKESQASGG